jgi:hypothetical protein
MPDFAIALLLKPFVALAILAGICLPVRLLIERRMKEGRLKRLLLSRFGH